MKKSLILLASMMFMLTFGCTKANAQSQDFFVRAGASMNYFWGEDDGTTKDRLSLSYNVTVGKWFNPYWGLQLEGNYGKVKGAGIGDTPYTTNEVVDNLQGEGSSLGNYKEKWNFLTVSPEIVYNVSNGMCGYNPKRVWNVLVHVGPGFARSWANGQNANTWCGIGGLTSTWRLCRNVQLWADGRFIVFDKKFDHETYRNDQDYMQSISAGISINFGK